MMGLPFGIPNRSAALWICIPLKIAAIIPIALLSKVDRWFFGFAPLRDNLRHDQGVPNPAFGADEVIHFPWIIGGHYYPLPMSLGTSDLSE